MGIKNIIAMVPVKFRTSVKLGAGRALLSTNPRGVEFGVSAPAACDSHENRISAGLFFFPFQLQLDN